VLGKINILFLFSDAATTFTVSWNCIQSCSTLPCSCKS